jgi:hypothetical protein
MASKEMTQKRSKPSRAHTSSPSDSLDPTQSLPFTNDAQQFFDMVKAIVDTQITRAVVPHCHCSHTPPDNFSPHGSPTPQGSSPQQSSSTQQTSNSPDSVKGASTPEYVSMGQLKQLFEAVLQQKPQSTPEGPASGPAASERRRKGQEERRHEGPWLQGGK